MNEIRRKWAKAYGYSPSDSEILSSYQNGGLTLSDRQENELLKYFKL